MKSQKSTTTPAFKDVDFETGFEPEIALFRTQSGTCCSQFQIRRFLSQSFAFRDTETPAGGVPLRIPASRLARYRRERSRLLSRLQSGQSALHFRNNLEGSIVEHREHCF